MANLVSSELSRMGLNASSEWMDACVQFCKSQTAGLSGQALVKAVVDQWLDADITVEGTQAGPQFKVNLSPDVLKGPLLQGRFCVQVQGALDIGQNSAYVQLQNVLKVNNDNNTFSSDVDTQRPFTAAWEPKSKRMLRMTITDGVKFVQALEFEPIHQIPYPVPPGLKLEIRGPVQIRRGVLLLQSKNVKVLGGQVSDMEETCSLVNQLKAVLGNENVENIMAKQRRIPTSSNTTQPRTIAPALTTPSVSTTTSAFDDDDDSLFNAIDQNIGMNTEARPGGQRRPPSRQTGRNVPQKKYEPSNDEFPDDDALFQDFEVPTTKPVRKTLKRTTQPPPKAPRVKNTKLEVKKESSHDDEFPDDDAFLCEAAESCFQPRAASTAPKLDRKIQAEAERGLKSLSGIKKEISSQVLPNVKQEVVSDGIPEDDDSFFAAVEVPDLPLVTKNSQVSVPQTQNEEVPGNCLTVAERPFGYLSQVPENSAAVATVKGCMVSLASKLKVVKINGEKCWQVKVIFTDSTRSLIASLSNSIIVDTFGFTPADYDNFSREQQRTRMQLATSSLSKKLLTFNGLVRMKFFQGSNEPEILDLTSLNRGHLQQLKNRVNRSQI